MYSNFIENYSDLKRAYVNLMKARRFMIQLSIFDQQKSMA